MKCPNCYKDKNTVLSTRECERWIRRRRECLCCGYRFTTKERYYEELYEKTKI